MVVVAVVEVVEVVVESATVVVVVVVVEVVEVVVVEVVEVVVESATVVVVVEVDDIKDSLFETSLPPQMKLIILKVTQARLIIKLSQNMCVMCVLYFKFGGVLWLRSAWWR